MRSLLALIVWSFIGLVHSHAQVTLPAELKLKPNRLGKLQAVCDTPVRWINLNDDLDVLPDSSQKFVFLLAAKVGRYRIAVYTASKDGTPSEPAYCTIIVEGDSPAPPQTPTPPGPKANVEASIVKLRFGASGCTATIMGPRRVDGRWDVLTAAHCTGPVGTKGKVTLLDGREFNVTVLVRNTTADISWMVADLNEALTGYAMLAKENPPIATPIWHKGYGVDKPGNKEEGVVASVQDSNGQIKMTLSVSSGDSGSGIFRTDTNEVVAVVCCTSAMARRGAMWGGCAVKAVQLRPAGTTSEPAFDEEYPLPIPIREDVERLMPFAWLE